MAPELALETLRELPENSVVLDPMAGSGTVLRHAIDVGHRARGRDLDPLALLMAKVWTTRVDTSLVKDVFGDVVSRALKTRSGECRLPWIDGSEEDRAFTHFWFAAKQRKDLRRIAFAIRDMELRSRSADEVDALDVVKVALSRIIVTKEQCASLARDTSHSRPHKVADKSDYEVFLGLDRSLRLVCDRLDAHPVPPRRSTVAMGDARAVDLRAKSVDAVLTSPPYLNAIDYMRGHRLALVWLGHSLADLRAIRSSAIGAERGNLGHIELLTDLRPALGDVKSLSNRHKSMVDRYLIDIYRMVRESKRVLRAGGIATFVVGNSCLRGVYIRNAEAVAVSAELCGFKPTRRYERELPSRSRYLPVGAGSALGNRMRSETLLSFAA